MRRAWTHFLVVTAAALIAGCGTDGGVGGTGISTLTGNVSAGSRVARVAGEIEGIDVSIRGTDLKTTTDAHGNFELEGSFDGAVTVDFRERDGTLSMLLARVPSGGIVSLRNVKFSQGQAWPEQIDVDFEATVSGDPVCTDGSSSISVRDRDPYTPNDFAVSVDGNTNFESDDGCPESPDCDDLARNFTVRVRGVQADDQIHADSVRLITCRTPGRGR